MTKRTAALSLLMMLTSTLFGALPQKETLSLPPVSKLRLKNGLTVLLMEQREVPIVSFSFIVKAGSVTDPAGKEGLASLTADLLRKGTKSRTSSQISAELDFIGGSFEMTATDDFSEGSAEFLKKDLLKGLDLIADVILNPAFPPGEVDKMIRQRIDGITSAKDRADSVISRYFNAYLYGNHPYARPVGGDEASLPSITPADIKNFYETQYAPPNLILAVVGDFGVTEMQKLLEDRFGGWPAKSVTSIPIEQPTPVRGKRLLLVDKPDSTQTYFYLGNVGISRTNPDRVGIGIVNTLFGGRYTSRLNTALRVDSGLTYGARSAFDQRRLAGPFIISSYTRNATTEKALDMALEVLRGFHDQGVTEDELESAKMYIEGQFPPTIETSDRLASTIARLEAYGLDESEINSYYSRVDAFTVADARRIIQQYFPSTDIVFVLVGKASEIQGVVNKYASTMDTKRISDPGF